MKNPTPPNKAIPNITHKAIIQPETPPFYFSGTNELGSTVALKVTSLGTA